MHHGQAAAGVTIMLTVFAASAGASSPARALPREVYINWDLSTTDDSKRLVIGVKEGALPQAEISGAAAYGFRLRAEDHVVIVLRWKGDKSKGDISYAVTGTNYDAKDLDALKKLVTGAAPAAKDPGKTALAEDEAQSITKAVTDDLRAGGALTATFTLKETQGTGTAAKEVTSYTSGGVTFRVDGHSPRFTVSNGVALSGAARTSVAIVKTATLLTFTKDGKSQQAYEQAISLKDHDTSLQPVQSLLAFANFEFTERVYATIGSQLNAKLFEEPMLGITYRHPITGSMGLNATGGVHFSKELEILRGSGFSDGMKLDPTIGLTVDDIPTQKKYHNRPFLAFSLDF